MRGQKNCAGWTCTYHGAGIGNILTLRKVDISASWLKLSQRLLLYFLISNNNFLCLSRLNIHLSKIDGEQNSSIRSACLKLETCLLRRRRGIEHVLSWNTSRITYHKLFDLWQDNSYLTLSKIEGGQNSSILSIMRSACAIISFSVQLFVFTSSTCVIFLARGIQLSYASLSCCR